MHPCEPDIETLKKLERELYRTPSTPENIKKLMAVTAQIKRRTAEAEALRHKESTPAAAC